MNYEPGTLDVQALKSGDYLQLLNLFPLDGLELTLKEFRVRGGGPGTGTGLGPDGGGLYGAPGLGGGGLYGAPAVLERAVEAWVRDIYANQMHRVVSGAAPFKGLSNIGAGLQDLLLIPVKVGRFSDSIIITISN